MTNETEKTITKYVEHLNIHNLDKKSVDMTGSDWYIGEFDMSVYKEGYRAVEEAMGHPSPEFWVERKYD
jgi:hypothetical protein